MCDCGLHRNLCPIPFVTKSGHCPYRMTCSDVALHILKEFCGDRSHSGSEGVLRLRYSKYLPAVPAFRSWISFLVMHHQTDLSQLGLSSSRFSVEVSGRSSRNPFMKVSTNLHRTCGQLNSYSLPNSTLGFLPAPRRLKEGRTPRNRNSWPTPIFRSSIAFLQSSLYNSIFPIAVQKT